MRDLGNQEVLADITIVSFYSSGGTPHVCLVCGSSLIFALLDT
jgi:hypothetical protein